jgi:hypothetical protein
MLAKGSFQVTMQAEPPFDDVDGVPHSRAQFDKVFSGPLQASGKVQMLAARTPIATSAGYVALERIVGTLDGKSGSFSVVHVGLMDRGARSLEITVVPDSGTGELSRIRGKMDIQIVSGEHLYELDYSFDDSAV